MLTNDPSSTWWRRLKSRAGLGLVYAAVMVSSTATCRSGSADRPEDREAVCRTWCERRGECFEPGDDVYPKADCVEVCLGSETWDVCGDELLEQHECFNRLECVDFVKYGAAEDAPCHEEVVETSDCWARRPRAAGSEADR